MIWLFFCKRWSLVWQETTKDNKEIEETRKRGKARHKHARETWSKIHCRHKREHFQIFSFAHKDSEGGVSGIDTWIAQFRRPMCVTWTPGSSLKILCGQKRVARVYPWPLSLTHCALVPHRATHYWSPYKPPPPPKKKKTKEKRKKQTKESKPKEGLGDVRWPFGPPHLNMNLPELPKNNHPPKKQIACCLFCKHFWKIFRNLKTRENTTKVGMSASPKSPQKLDQKDQRILLGNVVFFIWNSSFHLVAFFAVFCPYGHEKAQMSENPISL